MVSTKAADGSTITETIYYLLEFTFDLKYTGHRPLFETEKIIKFEIPFAAAYTRHISVNPPAYITSFKTFIMEKSAILQLQTTHKGKKNH